MVEHHAARAAAGAAGIDDAGNVVAGQRGHARLHRRPGGNGVAGLQCLPLVDREAAALRRWQGIHRHQVFRLARAQHGPDQRLCQTFVRDEHAACAAVIEDVAVVAFGVGGVGRGGDAAGGHDGKVGNAPFGPVFGHQHDPVARLQAQPDEAFGEQAHPPRRLGIADRLPCPVDAGGQEGHMAPFVGTLEEQAHQRPCLHDVVKLHGLANSHLAAGSSRPVATLQVQLTRGTWEQRQDWPFAGYRGPASAGANPSACPSPAGPEPGSAGIRTSSVRRGSNAARHVPSA